MRFLSSKANVSTDAEYPVVYFERCARNDLRCLIRSRKSKLVRAWFQRTISRQSEQTVRNQVQRFCGMLLIELRLPSLQLSGVDRNALAWADVLSDLGCSDSAFIGQGLKQRFDFFLLQVLLELPLSNLALVLSFASTCEPGYSFPSLLKDSRGMETVAVPQGLHHRLKREFISEVFDLECIFDAVPLRRADFACARL